MLTYRKTCKKALLKFLSTSTACKTGVYLKSALVRIIKEKQRELISSASGQNLDLFSPPLSHNPFNLLIRIYRMVNDE
jgi:hypothetical protein